jgi:alpha-ketoglutarate-dependent taurine dioxygenase
MGPLSEGDTLPWLIEPAMPGLSLSEWAAANRNGVDDLLARHRALLFRGFGVDSAQELDRFVSATSRGDKLSYRDRTTPRTVEGDRIYTSTVHPADQQIRLHNEGTYWIRWPMKLYFSCAKVAAQGGETPIADVRRVYQHIQPEIRERFEDAQMMLVRNYNDGFGLSWEETYQTHDRAEVEAYCVQNRIEFEWKDGGRLRTRQVRPAIRLHPKSGEPVWFNHVAFFHHTSLEPDVRDVLLSEFGEDGLPYDSRYGDGSPIEAEVIAHLRDAYARERVVFPWQQGDALLLDNMSVAHGRETYQGERRILVAMTEAAGQSGSQ